VQDFKFKKVVYFKGGGEISLKIKVMYYFR